MRVEMFKPVLDDWHPNYKINQGTPSERDVVRVVYLKLPSKKSLWRVCVWGNDDTGMEKDFTDSEEARKAFLKVAILDSVSRTTFLQMGFGFV